MLPKQPQPNIFFSPIEDNREQVLQSMKNELDFHLENTRNTLPSRQLPMLLDPNYRQQFQYQYPHLQDYQQR